MKPIVLTQYGETLLEYPKDNYGSSVERDQDNSEDEQAELSCCVGVHAVCRGWVDHSEISETYQVLTCRKCNLRFMFPKEVKTYGDLRAFCEVRLSPQLYREPPKGMDD